MNWKDYLLILGLSLITLVAFALYQSAPGYMDAEYYYAMGLRIARDRTLSEPFSWNYLNGFNGLPQPGFRFWMPFPAFLAGLSMMVSRGFDFPHARILFVLIAACVPILTAAIAFRILERKEIAVLAGLLSLFPVFYAPFLTSIDTFGVMMVLGAVYLLIAYQSKGGWKFYLLGVLAGLMHLTRTDGFIWLIPAIFIALEDKKTALSRMTISVFGYLSVMFPWFIRNWIVFKSPLPSGNTRMFWLTSYDDLFLYHAELLTVSGWMEQGFRSIINNIYNAFISNLQTALFIQGQIILFPLILVGIIQFRKNKVIRSILITWFLVFIVMTVFFPFAGSRGGFFHSGAAFQPIFVFLAAAGLDRSIKLGIKKRNWNEKQAHLIFNTGLILMLLGMTVFVHFQRVQGISAMDIQWNRGYLMALEVDDTLEKMGIPIDEVVMINNPPGLYIASGRPSIAIPSGGVQEIFDAAEDAQTEILILEKNHPESLDFLYKDPQAQANFLLIKAKDGIQYYEIRPGEEQ